jgi:hypothetical protein
LTNKSSLLYNLKTVEERRHMQNIRGFFAWMFRGWYRDITFWGMIIGMAAFVNMWLDGDIVTAWLLLSVGLALIMFDLIWRFLRWQYSVYTMERDRVARELERK